MYTVISLQNENIWRYFNYSLNLFTFCYFYLVYWFYPERNNIVPVIANILNYVAVQIKQNQTQDI